MTGNVGTCLQLEWTDSGGFEMVTRCFFTFIFIAFATDVVCFTPVPGILDDDNDDVLVNVNMQDDEKYKENIENKKKKPAYNPYDDSQVDELGMVSIEGCLFSFEDSP